MLIDYLDSIEPDPDLEPSLAGSVCWDAGSTDLELDEADNEPWLGWTGAMCQGGPNWRGEIGNDDREFDGDDLEPDVDVEPHGGGFEGSGSGPEAVRAMS